MRNNLRLVMKLYSKLVEQENADIKEVPCKVQVYKFTHAVGQADTYELDRTFKNNIRFLLPATLFNLQDAVEHCIKQENKYCEINKSKIRVVFENTPYLFNIENYQDAKDILNFLKLKLY